MSKKADTRAGAKHAGGASSSKGDSGKDKSSSSGGGKGEHAEPMQRGRAFLLFRPKVDVDEAHALKEVAKLYLWLAPEKVKLADHVAHSLTEHAGDKRKHEAEADAKDASATEGEAPPHKKAKTHEPHSGSSAGDAHPLAADAKEVRSKHVLLVIPSKRLPTGNVRQPHWAFVDAVGSLVDIKAHLGEFHYHTKTLGDRTTHAARIVAECAYEIAVDKDSKHTYLYYRLELPEEPTEVQKAFHISQSGVMLVQVKNPHSSNANRWGDVVAGLGKDAKARYPAELQAHFKGVRVAETKFASLHPDMLNYVGTELLLLGVKSSPKVLLGADEVEWLERVAAEESREVAKDETAEKEQVKHLTGIDVEPALEHW